MLGDVVLINGAGETGYSSLQEALEAIPNPLTEEITIEIRVDGALRDVGAVFITLPDDNNFQVHVTSGSNGTNVVRGKVLGDSFGFWLTAGTNLKLSNIDIEAPNSIGAVRLGNSKTDSVIIENCKLTAQYAVWAATAQNLTLKNNDLHNCAFALFDITDCKSVYLTGNTFNTVTTPNAALIGISNSDYVEIDDMSFPDGSYNSWAIRSTDCQHLIFNRLFGGHGAAGTASQFYRAVQSSNFYSADQITITNCVIDREHDIIVLEGAKEVIIRNCVFRLNETHSANPRLLYIDRGFGVIDNNQPLNIVLENNIFVTESTSGTKVSWYDLGVSQTESSKTNYVTNNNLFYTTIASQTWTYSTTSDFTNRTYSTLSSVQSSGFESNSHQDAVQPLALPDYNCVIGSNARNNGSNSNLTYLDYNGNIRDQVTPDIGAIDNDSTSYIDEQLNAQFFLYNAITDSSNSIIDNQVGIARFDDVYFIPSLSSGVANEYKWTLVSGGTSYVRYAKRFYINNTPQLTFNTTLLANNPTFSDTTTKNNYFVVEKQRPVPSFTVQTSTVPAFINTTTIDVVDTSTASETWSYQIETTPNSGLFDTYNTQNVTGLTKANAGQYTIKQTVTNSGTLTGVRTATLVQEKALAVVEQFNSPQVEIIVQEVCEAGTLLTFSLNIESTTAITDYEWRFNGGDIANSTVASPQVQFDTVGKFDVAVKVTNEAGFSVWVYERRLITVTESLQGKTVHEVNVATLPDDIEQAQRFVMLNNDTLGALPGDVIKLYGTVPDNRGLRLRNFQADTLNPFIIGNREGDIVRINYSNVISRFVNGLNVRDCQNVIFNFKIGNYANTHYGLEIQSLSNLSEPLDDGVSIDFFSSGIEMFGVWIKSCGFPAFQVIMQVGSSVYNDPRWVAGQGYRMQGTTIHHCKVDENRGETFYVGYNSTCGQDGLNGDRPAIMENGLIYRNDCRNPQKDGFQLNNALGIWEIHDNVFTNVATLNEANQNSGISIGGDRSHTVVNGHTELWIYHNKFIGFPANAMQLFGYQNIYCFGNLFAGQTTNNTMMYYHQGGDMPVTENLVIVGNTFVGNGQNFYFNMDREICGMVTENTRIQNLTIKNNLHVVNDTVEISAEKGNLDDLNFINNSRMNGYQGQNLWKIAVKDISNNIFYGQSRIGDFFFFNPTTNDYRILSGSVAENAGVEITNIPFANIGLEDADLGGYLRPMDNTQFAVGAYEIASSNSNQNPNVGEPVTQPGAGTGGEALPVICKFNLPYGIHIANNDPIDDRDLVDTLSDRDLLVTNNVAWKGMQVYVVAENKTYQLQGATNLDWVEFGATAPPVASNPVLPVAGTSAADLELTFDGDINYQLWQQAHTLNITLATTGNIGGNVISLEIEADGISDLTFSNDYEVVGTGTFDNTTATKNYVYMHYVSMSQKVRVSITQ